MRERIWLCIKRCPKPNVFVLVSLITLVYISNISIKNFRDGMEVTVFDRNRIISEESLEIVLCPTPRVYVMRLLKLGKLIPRFLRKQILHDLVIPFVEEHSETGGIQAVDREAQKYGVETDLIHCMFDNREARLSDSFEVFLAHLLKSHACANPRLAGLLNDAFGDGQKIREYLEARFETLDERLMEEYPALFEQAWVLQYENITVRDMLDQVAVNLTKYLDNAALHRSASDDGGPRHDLRSSPVSTRMAPMCFRHVLYSTGDDSPSHQRATLTYSFIKDTCPRESSSESRWPCLRTGDIYLTMYITPHNQFTDVPAASTIVPYRVSMDRQTLIRVSARKRTREGYCKHYGSRESKVTCTEECLLETLYTHINCSLPWLGRLLERFPPDSKLPACKTKSELDRTIGLVRSRFDVEATSACARKCPRHCHQVTITPRLAGSIRVRNTSRSRLPGVQLVIANTLPVHTDEFSYDLVDFEIELMNNASFLAGLSLVALCDWLVGVALWLLGELAFIPAMPPLIKHELRTSELCCRGEDDDHFLDDDVRTYIAGSYGTSRRGRRDAFVATRHDRDLRAQQAAAGADDRGHFPSFAMRPSVMTTVMQSFSAGRSSRDGRTGRRDAYISRGGRGAGTHFWRGRGQRGRGMAQGRGGPQRQGTPPRVGQDTARPAAGARGAAAARPGPAQATRGLNRP